MTRKNWDRVSDEHLSIISHDPRDPKKSIVLPISSKAIAKTGTVAYSPTILQDILSLYFQDLLIGM